MSATQTARAALEAAGILSARASKPEPRRPSREKMVATRAELLERAAADLPRLRSEIAQQREKREAAMATAAEPFNLRLAALHAEVRELEAGYEEGLKLDRELRQACEAALAENGPVIAWLQAVGGHVMTHFSIEDESVDQALASMERAGVPDGNVDLRRLRENVRRRQDCQPVLDAVEELRELVRVAQVEAKPDLASPAAALRERIPAQCPGCGAFFPELGG